MIIHGVGKVIIDTKEVTEQEQKRIGRLRQWAINAVNKKFEFVLINPPEKTNGRFSHKGRQEGVVMLIKKKKRKG